MYICMYTCMYVCVGQGISTTVVGAFSLSTLLVHKYLQIIHIYHGHIYTSVHASLLISLLYHPCITIEQSPIIRVIIRDHLSPQIAVTRDHTHVTKPTPRLSLPGITQITPGCHHLRSRNHTRYTRLTCQVVVTWGHTDRTVTSGLIPQVAVIYGITQITPSH